jgi:hypothetical protein
MTIDTTFVVQAFNNGKDGRLCATARVACGSADGARRTAERLSLSHIGAVAFTIRSDSETGDCDDQPTIFYRAGQLPTEFELMPNGYCTRSCKIMDCPISPFCWLSRIEATTVSGELNLL